MAKLDAIPIGTTRAEKAKYYVEGYGPCSSLTLKCWLDNVDNLRYAYERESKRGEKRDGK